MTATQRGRRFAGHLVLAATVALGALGLTACDPEGDIRFLDAPLATHRVDGVGWAVALTPNRIYLGGTFTTVRNQSGQAQGSFANLAAFDRTTGTVIPGFRADTNGIVRTVAVSGNTLYLGGDFTTVNGQPRARVAAVDLTTGAVRAFRADTNRVNKVVVGGDRLYVAGAFTAIGGVPRNRVAALDLTTGAVDPTFDPNVNAMVNTIAVRPDRSRVFIGGLYTNVHGTATTRLTALDGHTGAVVGPTFLDVSGEALDLELNKAGTRLVAALAEYGNQGAVFNTSTGSKVFRQRCGGDAQAVAIAGDNWYTGVHEECEGDVSIRLVGNSLLTGARQSEWLPAFDRFWGVRDLATDGRILVVAGDFTTVAGVPAQGFALFPAALRSTATG
jgi:outer membrane protein assembly factor BamB